MTFDLKVFVKEIALTAVGAGAVAGLTVVGNDVPVVADHYGWGAVASAQLVLVVGAVRAIVSNFFSEKKPDA
jgi:hypothetical protein